MVLLRGINVGGKNSVAMSDLRALVESLGFSEVTTYIQSGNVVFGAKEAPEAKDLEAAIADRFGIPIAVALRSASDVRRTLTGNPFPDADTSTLHVGFLAFEPPMSVLSELDGSPFAPEEFAVRGAEVYLLLPNGMGRAKLPSYLDRKLRIPTTFRNWNTLTKLAALAGPE